MTENQIKIIEELIKERNYQKAETLLNKLLQVVPDDWQGKLLLGTCKLLQGDIDTARHIHAEVEIYFESQTDLTDEEKTFWQKYKNIIIPYGTIAFLVAGAVIGSAIWFGKSISGGLQPSLYAGPMYYEMKKISETIQPATQEKLSNEQVTYDRKSD